MIDVDAMLKERFQNYDETNKPLVKAAASVLKKLVHQTKLIVSSRHISTLKDWNLMTLYSIILILLFKCLAKIAPIYPTSSVY